MWTQDQSGYRRTRYLVFIILVVLLAVATAVFFYANDYPTVEILFSILISYALGVFVHELGHALAAVLTGGTVDCIRLGQRSKDSKPWQVHFLGMKWYIYSLPMSGDVHSLFYTTQFYRLRSCFVIVMGPFTNMALLLGAFWLIEMFPTGHPSRILLGCMIANGCILLYNVWPRNIRSYGLTTPNDGLLLWQTINYSDDETQRFVENAKQVRSSNENSILAKKLSIPELLTKHEAEPTHLIFLWYLTEKLRLAKDPRYLNFLLKLLELRIPEQTAGELIDAGLTGQLHQGAPKQPDVVDQLSQRLLKIDDCLSTRGTRGSVLIDLGRIEEGKTMLEDVLIKTTSTIDKTYANIFLALAEKQQGNIALAREHAQKAANIDPACPALKRVSDLLAPTLETEKAQ
jgi:hypothetical protein